MFRLKQLEQKAAGEKAFAAAFSKKQCVRLLRDA
jgi:hypothetical protein